MLVPGMEWLTAFQRGVESMLHLWLVGLAPVLPKLETALDALVAASVHASAVDARDVVPVAALAVASVYASVHAPAAASESVCGAALVAAYVAAPVHACQAPAHDQALQVHETRLVLEQVRTAEKQGRRNPLAAGLHSAQSILAAVDQALQPGAVPAWGPQAEGILCLVPLWSLVDFG